MSEKDSQQYSGDQRRGGHVTRSVYLLVAGCFFVLGVAGAALPGLPATPFLLLTSYFLVRCSPRLNDRLLRMRLVGPILVDWQERGGVRRHVKLQAITFVVLAIAATLYFPAFSPLAKIAVSLLAGVGIVVVLRLPVARDED